MSKSAKIRRMLARGLDAKEIVKRLKVPVNLVHQVKYADKKAASESRKAVLERTMPRIEKEVRGVKAALDFLGAEKAQVGKMPKKLFVQPQHLDDALKVLGGKFKVTPRNFTKAEIEALGGKDVFNTLGTDDEVHRALERVNHPPHYTAGGIETIDFIEAKDLNYRLGNVIKYVSRAEKKENPLEDLKKAKWYLEREIATRERA
jgi:hypothetical protein